MKLQSRTFVIAFSCAALLHLATGVAQAYYNPQTGRWLSRDLAGEPGFEVLRSGRALQPAMQPAAASLPQGRWFNRDPLVSPGSQVALAGGLGALEAVSEAELTKSSVRREPADLNSYGFVLNDPLARVDALGLISFDGCSEQQKMQLRNGWDEACAKLNDPRFQCCVNRSELLKLMKRRCSWGNVKFQCRQAGSLWCPQNTCANSWKSIIGGINRGVIVVCYPTINDPGCGYLPCTLLHELTHVVEATPFEGGVVATVEKCCLK